MLGETLKKQIEAFYVDANRTNPLFVNARDGKLTTREIGNYLANVRYLIHYTPIYLRRARSRAHERGLGELAVFFSHKLREEDGHEAWAKNDLAALAKMSGRAPTENVSHGMVKLVERLEKLIDEDPRLYLAYIMLAEYFTVLIGPEWLGNLENRCGIPKNFMSVIGNHAELDKEHVAEGCREIDALVKDPAYRDPFLGVLKECMGLYAEFCREVADVQSL